MKGLKIFGFILLCVIAFIISIVISFQVTSIITISKISAPWKTTWDDSIGMIYKDIDINEKEQTGYDLYLPAKQSKEKNYSLILYIHGGGFASGDKSSGELICKYYASKGYVTASVNYTLADGKHDTNINLMFEQIRTQVESIKEKASEHGYNLREMAVTGESAGGCLALLYAYRVPEDSAIPIKFVFQMTGPTSFNPEYWGNANTEEAAGFISVMTGIEITEEMMNSGEATELVNKISPTSFINKNTVPSIIAYGLKDKIVPTSLKYPLMEAYDEYGVTYDYIEFPNSGHIMAADSDKTQEYANKIQEYLERYFDNK